MVKFDKKDLLITIANIDCNSSLENFLPLYEHNMILDNDRFLILGKSGSGKTCIFNLLNSSNGRIALTRSLELKHLPLGNTTYISGYGGKTKLSYPEKLGEHMKDESKNSWRSIWIGLMLSKIFELPNFPGNWAKEVPYHVRDCLVNNFSLFTIWLKYINSEFEYINYALDKLDEELLASNRWLFITYDELDTIVPYSELNKPISELLSFWLDRWRRWERIRPKIFLNTDLFQSDFRRFQDASKLVAHQVTLKWSSNLSWQLLLKHLANSNQEMYDYLKVIPGLINPHADYGLGRLPSSIEYHFQLFTEKMMGKYMKGRKPSTYYWICNNIPSIRPESFLKFFSLAAKSRLKKGNIEKLPKNQLLDPTDLRSALVSMNL